MEEEEQGEEAMEGEEPVVGETEEEEEGETIWQMCNQKIVLLYSRILQFQSHIVVSIPTLY